MIDAEPSRGSRLIRSRIARKQSNAVPDVQPISTQETNSMRIPDIRREQQIHDDGKALSSKRTKQDPKDSKEIVSSHSKSHELGADPEELETSRAVVPTAYDNSPVRNSIGETTSKRANDPKSGIRHRKRSKTVSTKLETVRRNRVNKQNLQKFEKQTTKKEKSKVDVEVQAKINRSQISSRKTKAEETTIGEEEETKERKDSPEKSKPRRKTILEKEAETMPLATRSTGLRMFVGAHVSSAKGWSLNSAISYTVYIASVKLSRYLYSRSAQCHYKLRAYRVKSLLQSICSLISLTIFI